MAGRCAQCGAPGSPSGAPASRGPVPTSHPATARRTARGSVLASGGHRGGNLGPTLRGYRHAGGVSNQRPGCLPGGPGSWASSAGPGTRPGGPG